MNPTFGGITIVADSTMTEIRETRIPGGYMNRWLIRAFVKVPSPNIIHDRILGRMYCHPVTLDRIKRECAKRGGL